MGVWKNVLLCDKGMKLLAIIESNQKSTFIWFICTSVGPFLPGDWEEKNN